MGLCSRPWPSRRGGDAVLRRPLPFLDVTVCRRRLGRSNAPKLQERLSALPWQSCFCFVFSLCARVFSFLHRRCDVRRKTKIHGGLATCALFSSEPALTLCAGGLLRIVALPGGRLPLLAAPFFGVSSRRPLPIALPDASTALPVLGCDPEKRAKFLAGRPVHVGVLGDTRASCTGLW